MPAVNLKTMDIDALLSLRSDVDKRLAQKRSELEKQLFRLRGEGSRGSGTVSARSGRRVSTMKGRKVAPKYRGPGGETWAGRGATPLWMRDEMKARKLKKEAFLIK